MSPPIHAEQLAAKTPQVMQRILHACTPPDFLGPPPTASSSRTGALAAGDDFANIASRPPPRHTVRARLGDIDGAGHVDDHAPGLVELPGLAPAASLARPTPKPGTDCPLSVTLS